MNAINDTIQAMTSTDPARLDFDAYMGDALRTEAPLSPVVGDAMFVPAAIDALVWAGKLADLLKKRLIYGVVVTEEKFIDVLQGLTDTSGDALDEIHDVNDPTFMEYNPRLLHAALGSLGESAELLEAMQTSINDCDALDSTHVAEEVGDQLWYAALAIDEVGRMTGLSPDKVAAMNISKLKARFPNKFTREKVVNRDLLSERKALGGGS